MSTKVFTSTVDHTSDAGFRAWGLEFSTTLQNINPSLLQKTTDTGQINWATVLRPIAPSTSAGFEIYKLTDSLFSTAPIYIRFNFGTAQAGTFTTPMIQFQIGTGTNGAGTLTGTVSGTQTLSYSASAVNSTTTPYISYFCVRDGFFGFLWKVNAFNTGAGALFILTRSCDTTGTFTTDGYQVIFSGNNGSNPARCYEVSVRTLSPAVVQAVSQAFSILPGAVTTSLAQGSLQVYTCWMSVPFVQASIGTCMYVSGEIVTLGTFTAIPVGRTAHTYLALGQQGGIADANSVANSSLAMLWE